NGVPLELIFAIFFPAVTGFTAGVAMSGDLKNPKKAIPFGTLTAVAVGFIVYVVLAIGLAWFVNRDLLINDTNFLLKIAWFSPLVVAGIWGATLSSALGGILGGPRILQAISSDRITPKIFAKGYGAGNEPRNALILIFLIAEGGILIGELNVIAGIVSMFYLASYGFINLAYYLESWASTDFRPSFKINRSIALVGFLASFGVMFKLDMVSMFASLIILLGLYFLLKRKQMMLDYGDVWQSVWSTVIRTALKRLDSSKIEPRNWKPNIVLFSGGTKKRPHLIELGKAIVGKYGMLSNFDLIEKEDSETLFPKHKKSMPGEISDTGVFFRRQTVKDIYDGVEMIARTYGFSGVEPNTIIMGWGRQTRDPARFTKLIHTLNKLDFNILLLDYDKHKGFGNYKRVDIWWEGAGNQGHLALTLAKFLMMSEKWKDVSLRLLIVNPINNERDQVKKKAENIADELRINADIKIINNQVEQKDFYDIVLVESEASDLIFIGIPEFNENEATAFIRKTNKLFNHTGTTALLKASSHFKELSIKPVSEKIKLISKGIGLIVPDNIEQIEIQYPLKV
ncbi:MAG: Na-K-Cl cotransporter, partial [Bacteroidota bacterium]|nr:Na-K-Cl cotransporter [Bacteroidota bacterium]